jgi:hypothetical protein
MLAAANASKGKKKKWSKGKVKEKVRTHRYDRGMGSSVSAASERAAFCFHCVSER